jgi:hypothetical protein
MAGGLGAGERPKGRGNQDSGCGSSEETELGDDFLESRPEGKFVYG